MIGQRKTIKVTIPADAVGNFNSAKERAENEAMCKMTDTQYAIRLIVWAISKASKSN